MPRNFIATADDFGISPKADKNILNLIRLGKLDRVEIMMSKNITPDQVRELLASGINLDIHLHLIENKIDRWQKGIEPHIIEGGIVKRGLLFIWNLYFGKNKPKNAAAIWDRQIEEFTKLFGKIPDGISSHEHIHYFSPYFKEVLKLAQKYRISYLRFGAEDAIDASMENSIVASIIKFFRHRNTHLFSSSNLETSDYMISFDWVENNFEKYSSLIPPNKKTEMVFHPELDNEMKVLEAD